jgi:nicotinate-nucleotide pyrophosphorylase
MQSPVLIHIRDLMFSSKVVATARAIDVPFKVVRDVSILLKTPASRLIVDLNADGALDAAIQWKQIHGGYVTGFCGHVNLATIQRAREVGIDSVMTNGAFAGNLEAILQSVPAEDQSE